MLSLRCSCIEVVEEPRSDAGGLCSGWISSSHRLERAPWRARGWKRRTKFPADVCSKWPPASFYRISGAIRRRCELARQRWQNPVDECCREGLYGDCRVSLQSGSESEPEFERRRQCTQRSG